MENVTTTNCLYAALRHLIDHLAGLLDKLLLPSVIAHIAELGLLTRIIISILLAGFVLMNIFPFEPVVNCPGQRSRDEHLFNIFEIQLLNSIHPLDFTDFKSCGQQADERKSYQRNDDGKVLLQIVRRGYKQKIVDNSPGESVEFQINERVAYNPLDTVQPVESSNPGSVIQAVIECKPSGSSLGCVDYSGLFEYSNQVGLVSTSDRQSKLLKVEEQMVKVVTDALEQIDQVDATRDMEKISISDGVNIDSRSGTQAINSIDESERIISVINPDSSLDCQRIDLLRRSGGGNSEDIEILMLVVERSGDSLNLLSQ